MSLYEDVAQAPPLSGELGAVVQFLADHDVLYAAGDLVRAGGARLMIVDVALRIATTPSSTVDERRIKDSFFAELFGPTMGTLGLDLVARLVDAARSVGRAPATGPAPTVH